MVLTEMGSRFGCTFLFILFMVNVNLFFSECENGCSGHGTCTVFDMCICFRNWEGNDCRSRTCQYGLAFVDTPVGDIDSSGEVDGPDQLVAENSPEHPYGTYELFPNMRDSDMRRIDDSAHYYMECSNAGICNRETGVCDCYDGFEGAACQRMSCPGLPVCNGHGVCQTLKQLANLNSGSSYNLWNKNIIRGCSCDRGFFGPDCSLRYCPKAIDPLYNDDVTRYQYPMFMFAVMTTSDTYDINDGSNTLTKGSFAITVFDTFGQPYMTKPILAPASCGDILSALEAIGNNVIPVGETKCFHSSYVNKNALVTESEFTFRYSSMYTNYFSGTKEYEIRFVPASEAAGYVSSFAPNSSTDPFMTGDAYYLQFYGNPGYFPQPLISMYADGGSQRPTIGSRDGELILRSWSQGQQGLDVDMVTDFCKTVSVSVMVSDGEAFLWGPFNGYDLLKCLGTSDFDDSNNLIHRREINGITEVSEYDYGSPSNPHLVKLQRKVTVDEDGGFFALVWFDPIGTNFDGGAGFRYSAGSPSAVFRILHPMYSLDSFDGYNGAKFNIFTTNGVVQMVQNGTKAHFEFGSNHIYTTKESDPMSQNLGDVSDISCEHQGAQVGQNTSTWDCLDKNDYFFLVDPYVPTNNPAFMNIYRAESITRLKPKDAKGRGDIYGNSSANSFRNLITTDFHTNWMSGSQGSGRHHIYKFTPSPYSSFEYVSQCSNRGLCNNFEGVCECFSGYAGHACQVQASIMT